MANRPSRVPTDRKLVLPGLKRWLQEHGVGQFSNKRLGESLLPDDLPDEVDSLARELARFVDIPTA